MSGDPGILTGPDPRVEAVAACMYEHPAPWMRHQPDWSVCPDAARSWWRDEAVRVLAALDAMAPQDGQT